MKMRLDGYDWRDMMKNSSDVIKDWDGKHEALQFIRMDFENGHCTTYASSGYHLYRTTMPVSTGERFYDPFTALIRPIKTPAGVRAVTVSNDDPNALEVVFLDKDDAVIQTVRQEKENVDLFDAEKVLNKAMNNEVKYRIAVNPQYLISILSAMKSDDRVILHFGTAVQPILVTPAGTDSAADRMGVVLPVRV